MIFTTESVGVTSIRMPTTAASGHVNWIQRGGSPLPRLQRSSAQAV